MVYKVGDFMTKDVLIVDPEATVFEAAKKMVEKDIGSLVVRGEKGELGIITERDILRRVVAEEKDPRKVKVREIMSSPVITCTPETTIDEAAALMAMGRVRRLPVVDNDKVVGIITAYDVARARKVEMEKSYSIFLDILK
ncbi:MAG: CBS domain-containing protein [Candidatus Verstraetearchaeota archaeon]|nr:CBS domain-containing protein [Candidatus Verstraetearchaeota archaeon]